ncbi:MAG: hypothetical protein LLG06_18125 [Desulfobacteraceae bacterium]|nr:hypothetical protein [Desulfobacteraceae bacterium]
MPSAAETMDGIGIPPSSATRAIAEIYVDRRVGFVFYSLVVVFWIGQFWCSPYASAENHLELGNIYASYMNPLMRFIDSILEEQTLVGKRFSLYEICLGALAFYMVVTFQSCRRPTRFHLVFFFISVLTVVVSMLNPNNSFSQLKYLLATQPRILYLYLFFLYSFIFLRVDVLSALLQKFFKVGAITALALAFYTSMAFILGQGPVLLGSSTTLPNSFHLDLMALFSTVFLAIYLNTKKRNYLWCVILLHFVVLFGDRRTQVVILLSSDCLMAAYYLKGESFIRILKVLLVLGLTLSAVATMLVWVLDLKVGYFVERFTSLFISTEAVKDDLFSDSGHKEQTIATFVTLLENLDKFWGSGMRNELAHVEGQSAYIHNSFVAVWAAFGLHMVIFYFFVLLVFVKKAISLFLSERNKSTMIAASVTFTFLMTIVGSAFTGEYLFKQIMYVVELPLVIGALSYSTEIPAPTVRNKKKRTAR